MVSRHPPCSPTSLALTHRCPLDTSTHRARVHFRSLVSAAENGLLQRRRLAVAQNEDKVTLEVTLKVALPPSSKSYSLFSQPLSPPTVSRGRLILLSVSTPLPRSVTTLYWASCRSRSTVTFCPLLLPSSPSRANGSKRHHRRMAPNSNAEWVGAGGPMKRKIAGSK
jgi:hypothetical protein